jgi:hypothetical protein
MAAQPGCLPGYSWKTNQFGLTVDTVTAFELVKPNGDIVTVTESSDPDLFFGLKVVWFTPDFLRLLTDAIRTGWLKQLCMSFPWSPYFSNYFL